MEKITIIGGGVAGLSCLNALLDKGQSPLLLEEKTIGTPKICGEFIAPSAVAALQKWDLGPIQVINDVCFKAKDKSASLSFPAAAGAFSRSEAECVLAQRAYNKNGRIRELTHITKIEPQANQSAYQIHLASGEIIMSQALMIASGKVAQRNHSPVTLPYCGFKIHLPLVLKPETLFMCSHPGAYFGLVPIAANTSNLTCLVQAKIIEKWHSCTDFFHHLVTIDPLLKDLFSQIDLQSITWLEGKAPKFKAQQHPAWDNVYWIGDALASFYPAIGYGFAHSINSALIAADFYLQSDAKGYYKVLKNNIRSKLWMGTFMHHLLINPFLNPILMYALQSKPWLAPFFMHQAGISLRSSEL